MDFSDLPTVIEDKFEREQALIICLQFRPGKFEDEAVVNALFDLEEIIQLVVEETGVGVYDGNEFLESPEEDSITFFIYGENANDMYKEIEPLLAFLPNLPGSHITKCYDTSIHREEHVMLS